MLEDIDSEFKDTLTVEERMMKGAVLNNLGIVSFWNFLEKTREVKSVETLEKIPGLVQDFEDGIKHLKRSIRTFESMDERY